MTKILRDQVASIDSGGGVFGIRLSLYKAAVRFFLHGAPVRFSLHGAAVGFCLYEATRFRSGLHGREALGRFTTFRACAATTLTLNNLLAVRLQLNLSYELLRELVAVRLLRATEGDNSNG